MKLCTKRTDGVPVRVTYRAVRTPCPDTTNPPRAYVQPTLVVGFEGRFGRFYGAATLSVARRFTEQGSGAGGDPLHQVAVVCAALC